jgi:hypothetical protein
MNQENYVFLHLASGATLIDKIAELIPAGDPLA